jgi:hypothetical protein
MKNWTLGEIRKTNPIQTQTNPILSAVGGFRKAKMNLNSFITKDYEEKCG